MTAEKFLAEARSHLGYRTRPGGVSDFGQRVGYSGHDIPWSGAFIDVVARDSGISIPACVYTPSALAEFIYKNRWRERPRVGDIVFYSFPTTGSFGMPHVGIVTGCDDFATDGIFLAIEAQVNSGMPKGPKDNDGIFERVRWKREILGFARPDFKVRPARAPKIMTGPVSIKLEKIRLGKTSPDVAVVQDALVKKAELSRFTRETFDYRTQQAFARWQRQIGCVGIDATGLPDRSSLERLGRDTGLFKVAGEN
jgi:hypothetical protein